ncbi:unnamed protein product [Lactuca saligna]|uniref:Uncharacterized protein n=1 Tax=Lactuca saligna TaxID=75948 RepID=A0AA35YMD0_LACSI|nr:unnamed protein product [Lactuca saligna]
MKASLHGFIKSPLLRCIATFDIFSSSYVYRVSDMELVSVLPSAEDEVNVACFHPLAGVGLVYGTKEGKLRILQHDGGHAPIPDHFFEARAVEVQQLLYL